MRQVLPDEPGPGWLLARDTYILYFTTSQKAEYLIHQSLGGDFSFPYTQAIIYFYRNVNTSIDFTERLIQISVGIDASFNSGRIHQSTKTLHTTHTTIPPPDTLMLMPSVFSLSLATLIFYTRALMGIDPTLLRDKRTQARALPEYDQDVGGCQSEFFRIQVLLL